MLSSALDFFAPELLCQLYPEWRFEGLDGLSLVRATKIASRSAELAGMCCLIHDQTWTPFFAQIQHDPEGTEIEWMRCCVGIRGDGRGGLLRLPRASSDVGLALAIAQSPDGFDWVFTATLGEATIAQQDARC